MRLLEIQDGISINTDKIGGIERKTSDTCNIYVGGETYLAQISYENLKQILQNEAVISKSSSKEEQMAKTMEKLDKYLNVATITTV